MSNHENAKVTHIGVKIINNSKQLKKTKTMTKVKSAPISVEQTTEVFNTYLVENKVAFQTEKIKEFHYKLQGNSRDNLKDAIYLGELFEATKVIFLSAESKQARKNLGLKISIKYFLEQNFSLSESYINRLIQGYNNREKLTAYLETGHVGKSISIDNFNAYCNPKKETEATETEATETEATETEATNEGEQTAFGGITLTLNKATKEDIEQAIQFLKNKIS